MRLRYEDGIEGFRAELVGWLEKNLPSTEEIRRDPALTSAHMPPWARAWQRRLFDAGWLVPGWPPELGGRNATPIEQMVFFEEMAKLPVLRAYNPQGLSIILPSIRDYGSPQLQERFVLPTLRAEITWCLGMSEPGAGSDLAGLSTRAEVRDDHFLVNGQKVWTSGARHADYCFCFVRTDPEAPKHRGISVIVVDMKTPGIDVRPLAELLDKDHADFSEVFFNGVEVPRENLVGELNHGWSMAAGSLAHERGMLWIGQVSRLEDKFERIRELTRGPAAAGRRVGEDALFRDRMASLYVDSQALKFLGYRGFAKFARGHVSPEHSVLKLIGSELEQRAAQVAAEAQGTAALDVESQGFGHYEARHTEPWIWQYLRSFGNTIAGGTSEIQRNIVAQRVLGLPRR